MVRGFGVLLVIGIAIAFVCALTAGSAALVVAERDGGSVGAALRGAGEILVDAGRLLVRPLRSPAAAARGPAGRIAGRAGSASRTLISTAAARPGRVLAIAVALAAVGWIADTQTSVQSDVTKLVPSSMPALRDLHQLERVTGVSGEIDVTVRAKSVTTPQIVGWMLGYEQQLLSHYGYLETKGCARATLCPALSLPDLFSGGPQSSGSQNPAASLTQSSIDSLLAAVPPYFSQAVITSDHREATLAFGIRLMPLSRQQAVIDYMRSRLHPPPGVTARLAGLPVLAAEANSALSSSGRRLLTLIAGLLAVGIVLRLLLRRTERALIPLVPIALATGWSALVLFVTQIPLNPMSATLGALVIAISTEFSVLLSERYRQERDAGHDATSAMARTYASTGAAVVASGVTAIAGFGVLILSSITMLRDFGLVTVIDLTVSLGGVLLVLPAVLVLAERGNLLESARGALRLRRPGRPRLRRSAPAA
jgi:predicted RND superfamily exporter protein